MARRLIIWGSWVVVAGCLLYAAFFVGRLSGQSYQMQLETRRDALRLYEYFKTGDVDGAHRDGL